MTPLTFDPTGNTVDAIDDHVFHDFKFDRVTHVGRSR